MKNRETQRGKSPKKLMTSQKTSLGGNNPKKGFTLVELIIVITILAILATIAFVSFGGYLSSVRDANRVTTLKNMQNGLGLFFLKNNAYPDPADGKSYSGTHINGYMDTEQLKAISMNKLSLDPLDKTRYLYNTSHNHRKFQIGAFLEEKNDIYFTFVPQIYAKNIAYTKRYLYSLGDDLGIILEKETHTPIQELDEFDKEKEYIIIYPNQSQDEGQTATGGTLGEVIGGGKPQETPKEENSENNCILGQIILSDDKPNCILID